jgi:hypothetical protein
MLNIIDLVIKTMYFCALNIGKVQISESYVCHIDNLSIS